MMLKHYFNRRHSPNRRQTCVSARVRADGQVYDALVLNVSYKGMGLMVSAQLAPGTPVTVEVLGTTIPAIIHWYDRGAVGLHLLDRVERDILIALETAEDEFADFR